MRRTLVSLVAGGLVIAFIVMTVIFREQSALLFQHLLDGINGSFGIRLEKLRHGRIFGGREHAPEDEPRILDLGFQAVLANSQLLDPSGGRLPSRLPWPERHDPY